MKREMVVKLSEKSLFIIVSVSFLIGTTFGYKLKEWRIKYLKGKRNFLERKFRQVQNQLDIIAKN